MKVLIVGEGGREHALAWKAVQSTKVTEVFVAPGNGGTELEPNITNVDIAATDIERLLAFVIQEDIAVTIVGPEAPLALGIVDLFAEHQRTCIGPHQYNAQLESSKSFSKTFMTNHHIPTAKFATFTTADSAKHYLQTQSFPVVIKADGLAAGKGVIIAANYAEAVNAVTQMLTHKNFGDAGREIIIEEYLVGEELSFIVLADGKQAIVLASSQDHKRRDDGDQGPNTGGMGAYSPAPFLTAELEQKIMSTVINPTINAMATAGKPYQGFLYAGLIVGADNQLNVLEFNCRLGDPETQPIMLRLKTDLIDLCLACHEGTLDTLKADWDQRPAVGVVMTAGGYPETYTKGDLIEGLPCDENGVKVFHAGTRYENGNLLTNGGRILTVTALGDSIATAKAQAYQTVAKISWPNCYYRQDIAAKALINS